jgi:ABC-type cobalamin transport system permease subunit
MAMLYAGLAALVGWAAIVVAVTVLLGRSHAPGWATRTIKIAGATVAVLLIIAFALYGGLNQLLAENSMLWSLS